MFKKLSCAAVILAIFALGFAAGGYFMADGQLSVVSEANAGNCVNVEYQHATTYTNMPGHTCSYAIRFNKTPSIVNTSGTSLYIYFK